MTWSDVRAAAVYASAVRDAHLAAQRSRSAHVSALLVTNYLSLVRHLTQVRPLERYVLRGMQYDNIDREDLLMRWNRITLPIVLMISGLVLSVFLCLGSTVTIQQRLVAPPVGMIQLGPLTFIAEVTKTPHCSMLSSYCPSRPNNQDHFTLWIVTRTESSTATTHLFALPLQ